MTNREEIVAEILAERRRQVGEGWTSEHDDAENPDGQLALAAATYAWAAQVGPDARRVFQSDPHSTRTGWPAAVVFRRLWPWDLRFWKPTDPYGDLVKAAALMLSELERLDRARERVEVTR